MVTAGAVSYKAESVEEVVLIVQGRGLIVVGYYRRHIIRTLILETKKTSVLI